MKKVLIITRWYPPYPYPSLRIVGLVKYLPEFGWEPVLLTSSLGGLDLQCRVLTTPYRDVLGFWKKLLGFNSDQDIRRQVDARFSIASKNRLVDFIFTRVGEVLGYPDLDRGWKNFAVKAGSDFLQKEPVDAILSSSMPVISHLIANKLKKDFGTPWLADFRDLWTQKNNYRYGPVRKLLDEKLELRTISSADALVVISKPAEQSMMKFHTVKPVHVITNGFNPEEVNNLPAKLTPSFTITYTGSIYPGRQDPLKLFAALSDLISDGVIEPEKIEVRFFGPKEHWIEKEVRDYGISDIVKQYGAVTREDALEKQRESQLLLLLKWEDPRERGSYTGKIFEYLAARRPVLAIGGSQDVIDDLLYETKAGVCALTVEDIKRELTNLYNDYNLKGEVGYNGEESKVDMYSHREMAGKFSDILNKLTIAPLNES